MKTFGQLKNEIRRQCYPSGESENLAAQFPDGTPSPHDLIFQEGAAELCKWVDCLQTDNINIIHFCKTFTKCGMTVINAPPGVVRRVFAVKDTNFCDPVFYRQVDWPKPETWARSIQQWIGGLTTSTTNMPLGFGEADAANDSKCGRARSGIWAIHKDKIYIAPWIQSNEYVVVEWDGIKAEWSDDDPVNDQQDYKKALKLYFQYGHERDYGSVERANLIHNIQKSGTFDEALADLMYQCRENRKTRATEDYSESNRLLTFQQFQDGLPPVPKGASVIAQIGNFGQGTANSDAVAAAVINNAPSLIIGSGDLSSTPDYDAVVGKLFSEFIKPYTGAFDSDATTNRFLPAPGDSDWANNALADYLAFFEVINDRKYYDACFGDVHFFILDSNASEPDGITSTSAQAEWLKAKLLLSPALWKVVIVFSAPYSSTLAHVGLQWPFKLWGANMVISSSAKNYERFDVADVPFINNGLGGNSAIDTFSSQAANSVFQYATKYGFGRITVTPTTLEYEFVNTDGTVIDSVTLTK